MYPSAESWRSALDKADEPELICCPALLYAEFEPDDAAAAAWEYPVAICLSAATTALLASRSRGETAARLRVLAADE